MYYVTTEIKNDKKLKELFQKHLRFSPYNLKNEISYFHGPKHSMLIGTAYEILFQIELMKYKRQEFDMRYMKHSRSVSVIEDCIKLYKGEDKEKAYYILKTIQEHEFIIYKYLHGSKIKINKLLKAIIYLAFITGIRERDDIFRLEFIKHKDDLLDLNELRKSINKKILKKYSGEDISFNIGLGAGLLTGEIDILKNRNKIVDIKTTREGTFSNEMIYQLMMYYFLCKTNGLKIKSVSIFFVRFGKEEKIKIKDLIDKKGEKNILKYLKKKYQF